MLFSLLSGVYRFTKASRYIAPGKLTFHTATCLVNPDEVGNIVWTGGPRLTQKVLILWGKDDEEHITSDIWVLEIDGESIEDFTWRKVGITIL